MRRRTFATACGAAALAGCFGSDTDDPDENQPADGPSGNESDGGTGDTESGGGTGDTENDGDTGDTEGDGEDPLGARDPEPIEYSGTGDATTDPFEAQPGLTMLHVDPITNIAVDVVDASGSVWRSLEWDLRNYQGLVPIDVPSGQYTLEVRTDREWTIRVVRPEVGDGDLVSEPATLSGSDPDYLGPVEFAEINSAAIEQTGVGPFSLKLYALGGEYLGEVHDQEGIFETEQPINYGGQGWLLIASNDDYTVELQTEEVEGTGATDGGTGDSGGGNETA